MNPLLEHLADFLPVFLAGMAVNFEIAGIAIALGLALGLPLAAMRLQGGTVGNASISVIALMRAAPTFVVMFFLLNAMPVHHNGDGRNRIVFQHDDMMQPRLSIHQRKDSLQDIDQVFSGFRGVGRSGESQNILNQTLAA